ncbi:hypothetical protein IJJ39_02595, partial [Candidatus Saccharibacteria bacterium]|nr:hypothetical protein [Candidatus Saccharibacteria bacterium]
MKVIQKLKIKNNARRITNLVFRGLSGAYERGGRSASPVTTTQRSERKPSLLGFPSEAAMSAKSQTGASDSVSEKHLNGDSSCVTRFVLRHGLFLSLYSLIKKASGKLPWRSRTNHNSDSSSSSISSPSSYSSSSVSTSTRGLNTTRNYIKNFRRIRILGSASLFSLGLLLLATF